MDMTRLLINWLIANGPQVLGLVALLAALGAPLPMPIMVLVSGALVREGLIDVKSAVLFCFTGTLMAETLTYTAGRILGARIEDRVGRFGQLWRRAEARFGRRPGLTVYLTRFLLVPLGIPTNLLAGSTRYSYWRFVRFSLAGNAMWVVLYGAIGYAIGHGWRGALPWLTVYGGWLALPLVLGLLLYGLWLNRAAIPQARLLLAAVRVRRPRNWQ